MKRCAIYARVSTDMQAESLENQVTFAQEFITRFLGDEYITDDSLIYQDFDMSGFYTRFTDRQAVKRAIDDAKAKKFDVIIFKELSRVSRDQAEHLEIIGRFQQEGIRVIGINDSLDTDNPQSMEFLGIRSWMAEMESRRISSRVSSAKKAIARRGLWAGEAPIGYKLNSDTRKLDIDDEYADTVRTIFHMYVNGNGTYRIADYLNQHGLLTKNGRKWSRVTVNRVIRNRVYIGDTVYGTSRNQLKRIFTDDGYVKRQGREEIPSEQWIVVPNTHEPLIDVATFEKANRLMATRYHRKDQRSKYPLTGVLKCGYCGSNMLCQVRRHSLANGDVKYYRYYCCGAAFKFGRSTCPQRNVPADGLESAVIELFTSHLQSLKRRKYVLGQDYNELEHTKRIAKLESELEKLHFGLTRLLTSTDLPESTFQRMKTELSSQIQRIESEIEFEKNEMKSFTDNMSFQERINNKLKALSSMDRSDIEEMRTILTPAIDRMVVTDRNIDEITFRVM